MRFASMSCALVTVAMMSSALLAADKAYWPTFRGADRTGVSQETGLLKSWPEGGPKLLWKAEGAGNGYAGVAIADGKMYTIGDGPSNASDGDEYLTAYSIEDGKQLWSTKLGPAWTNGSPSWQGSRSTPTVDGEMVYTLTPQGVLYCHNTKGEKQWLKDLDLEYGGKKADQWGYSESPTIDGDVLLITPGGPETTVVALNKISGDKIWTSTRPEDRGAGHSCFVISNVGGRKVYVQTTGSGTMGLDPKTGKILWTFDIPKVTAVIPTPIVKDDLVFYVAGYDSGGALMRQVPDGDGVKIENIYPINSELKNKHGGVVLIDGYLYADSDDKGLPYCADFMTGEQKWKSRASGKNNAALSAADGHLYFQFADGTMVLAEANPAEFKETGSFKIPAKSTRPYWAHPAITGGKMYLRVDDEIFCYDIKE
ncbi:PQQ-binding-like beta-propeller repeat protein [Lacunimicrobium album]